MRTLKLPISLPTDKENLWGNKYVSYLGELLKIVFRLNLIKLI
jgi:hypothetical protein